MHDRLESMKLCPNGRYVLTTGDKGDASLWSITKKILAPETILDAIQQSNVNI
jgi:hypothetical protein